MKSFINENNIILNLNTEDKSLIIDKMVDTIPETKLIDKKKFICDIM